MKKRMDDDYSIYSTFSDYFIKNLSDRRINKFVFKLTTKRPEMFYEEDGGDLTLLMRFLPMIDKELIDSFTAKNTSSIQLEPKITVSIPIEFLNDSQVREIFKAENWDVFDEKFPDSQGLMSFSRIGYSKNGNQALLYYGNSCGMKCGGGGLVVLSKEGQDWKILVIFPMWIS